MVISTHARLNKTPKPDVSRLGWVCLNVKCACVALTIELMWRPSLYQAFTCTRSAMSGALRVLTLLSSSHLEPWILHLSALPPVSAFGFIWSAALSD